jgi:hypothetical protein
MGRALALQLLAVALLWTGAPLLAAAQRCLSAGVQWPAVGGIPPPSATRRMAILKMGPDCHSTSLILPALY